MAVCVFVCQFIAVITRNASGEWPVSDPRFFNIGLRPHRSSRSFRHLISSFHLSCVCLSDFRAITWEHESRNIIANLRVSLRMKNRVESGGDEGNGKKGCLVYAPSSRCFASYHHHLHHTVWFTARFSFDIIMRADSEQSQGYCKNSLNTAVRRCTEWYHWSGFDQCVGYQAVLKGRLDSAKQSVNTASSTWLP